MWLLLNPVVLFFSWLPNKANIGIEAKSYSVIFVQNESFRLSYLGICFLLCILLYTTIFL